MVEVLLRENKLKCDRMCDQYVYIAYRGMQNITLFYTSKLCMQKTV